MGEMRMEMFICSVLPVLDLSATLGTHRKAGHSGLCPESEDEGTETGGCLELTGQPV